MLSIQILLRFLTITLVSATILEENEVEELLAKVNNMEKLVKQVIGEQFDQAERDRSRHNSGLVSVRLLKEGTRPYHAHSHAGYRFASMHNHANNIDTIGLGEIKVMMNGVDFQTRHNDYSLYMPSLTSTNLHETEPIPFPEVPPEVTNLPTLDEQVRYP